MKLNRQTIEAQFAEIKRTRSMRAVGSMDFEPFDPFEMAANEGEKAGAGDLSPLINPGKMSDRERLDLLKRIDEGEVASVRFWAYAFGDKGNRNNVVVNAKQVRDMAKSAAKVLPALDGHGGFFDGSPASAIAGEISKGRADKVESGETKLALFHKVTEPEPMKSVVRGSWKWFSICFNADDFEFQLLDEDGKVTTDWEIAVDYQVVAIGSAWLIHNAFVADPAWGGSEFLNRAQGGALSREMATMPQGTKEGTPPANGADEVKELRAQLAASEEKVKGLEVALAAEQDAHFNTVFDGAKAQGKVSEGERKLYAMGAKVEGIGFVREQLMSRGSVVPMRTVGEAPNATPPAASSASAGEKPMSAKETDDLFERFGSPKPGKVSKKAAAGEE